MARTRRKPAVPLAAAAVAAALLALDEPGMVHRLIGATDRFAQIGECRCR